MSSVGPRPDTLLIWGGGGHGKVVADLIRTLGHRIAGFVDADPDKLGHCVEPGGGRVVLSEDALLNHLGTRAELPDGITGVALAIGDNAVREQRLLQLGDCVAHALVHPSAVISPSARIGRGSVVFALAVINADTRIGAGAIINTGAIVEHDCHLGAAVHLSPRATLAGIVRVGDRSWIGSGATVIPGLEIGDDAVIGAGAVVIRNVSDGLVVAGVPAKRLRPPVVRLVEPFA